MGEFFFQYGLFALKAVTIILLILLMLSIFVGVIVSRAKNRSIIEIEKINDHFDSLKYALEAEMLPKYEYKQLTKARKKKEKQQKKIDKLNSKKISAEIFEKTYVKKLFLLRFDGDMYASEIKNLRESITALLTVVNPRDEVCVVLESAGGIVQNYGLAASQLKRIRERKISLTIAVDLVAASGGYMMACVANKIIAAPFAIVGSVGVLAQVPNFYRLLNKYNIDIEHHTAGEHKSTLTMFGKNTNRARDKFREELEDTHELFKEFVKDNRPAIDVERIATGEHWYGTQAIDLNLIDEIKTSDDYLLEKSKTLDIYEITYHINESFREKFAALLYDFAAKFSEKTWQKFSQLCSVYK